MLMPGMAFDRDALLNGRAVRCRAQIRRRLRFSEELGREALAVEGRAFLPPDAGAELGGTLEIGGVKCVIRGLKAHESALARYVEVELS